VKKPALSSWLLFRQKKIFQHMANQCYFLSV
jgi:hypothetical protein